MAGEEMSGGPESYFDSFHKTAQGEFKNTYYNPFHVKPRKRTSKEQLAVLEKTFETNVKPDASLRKTLAVQLEMTPRSVQVWFQNRRAKVKNEQQSRKERKEKGGGEERAAARADDYESFLQHYVNFSNENQFGADERGRKEAAEDADFGEEYRSLDRLVLGEQEDGSGAEDARPGRRLYIDCYASAAEERVHEQDLGRTFCSFYAMSNSLPFDPGNYLGK